MRRAGVALLLLLLAAGCYEDRYRCTTDAQCDLGAGGRCERDGLCTQHDVRCATQRRYAPHAGAQSGTCFDDRVVPTNACAGGQPPARPEGCFAAVCARVPACCELAWTDACAQLAQEECAELACDTRLAITALRGANTELWAATWDGAAWSFVRHAELAPPLAWVAPAPGDVAPRLAATTPTELVIGDDRRPAVAGATYHAITSIDVDRGGRDTLAVGYQTAAGSFVELLDLERATRRVLRVNGAQSLAWGDRDRDGFVDGVAKQGTTYAFLDNIAGDDHVRTLSATAMGNLSGGATPGAPGVRAIDWADLDGDGRLDLVVMGASVRIHTTPAGLRDVPEHDLDCDPPSTARPCAGDAEPNLERVSLGGAALPARDAPALLLTTYPHRRLYRARVAAGAVTVERLPFPGDGCSCTATCNAGACTFGCNACPTIAAVVVRDLDGDHVLDVIAIDAKLAVYTARGPDLVFGPPAQIPTDFAGIVPAVGVSVSGAPR